MLRGRLGIETARVPHADRHGLIWLSHGSLYVEDGTLRFKTSGGSDLPRGDYAIPFQMVSCVVLQPGTTVSHDSLRLLARHGTGVVAVGDGGVRLYASMPFGPDDSSLARRQVTLWSDAEGSRISVARRLYAWRLGEVLPHADIAVLRGIEGSRAKVSYQRIAEQFGIEWASRKFDRSKPDAADAPNQAINHAATAVQAAAMVAVSVCGALPSLGFIHEDSGISFVLDIADLYRDSITLPVAFGAVKEWRKRPEEPLERVVRKLSGRLFREKQLVSAMIDRVKELLQHDDDHRNG